VIGQPGAGCPEYPDGPDTVVRRTLDERYATTCALVNQRGVCHQCVELDGFSNGGTCNPLSATSGTLDDRLNVLRRERTTPLGPWHRRMMTLVDDLLDG
jgi:RNA polymerase sigma-70 factor (ECF subfamily)